MISPPFRPNFADVLIFRNKVPLDQWKKKYGKLQAGDSFEFLIACDYLAKNRYLGQGNFNIGDKKRGFKN